MLSLAACGSKETMEYSGQTLYGKVTEISDNTITVQLGEWTETQEQPPEMANGNSNSAQVTILKKRLLHPPPRTETVFSAMVKEL